MAIETFASSPENREYPTTAEELRTFREQFLESKEPIKTKEQFDALAADRSHTIQVISLGTPNGPRAALQAQKMHELAAYFDQKGSLTSQVNVRELDRSNTQLRTALSASPYNILLLKDPSVVVMRDGQVIQYHEGVAKDALKGLIDQLLPPEEKTKQTETHDIIALKNIQQIKDIETDTSDFIHVIHLYAPNASKTDLLDRTQLEYAKTLRSNTTTKVKFWSCAATPAALAGLEKMGGKADRFPSLLFITGGKVAHIQTNALDEAGMDQLVTGVGREQAELIQKAQEHIRTGVSNESKPKESEKTPPIKKDLGYKLADTPTPSYTVGTEEKKPEPIVEKQPIIDAPNSGAAPLQPQGIEQHVGHRIDISKEGLRVKGELIRFLDTYVYAPAGVQLPVSWEFARSDKQHVPYLNGVDEGIGYLDKDLLRVNAASCIPGNRYKAKDLKYKLPLQFKVEVVQGVLQLYVQPSAELLAKYAKSSLTFPKMPTFSDLPDLQDLLPLFEGDDNESQDAYEGFAESILDLSKQGLTIHGKAVKNVVETVYGVPPALLGKIKVKYDTHRKLFVLYKENKLLNRTVEALNIPALESGTHSVSATFDLFGKEKHNGLIRAEVDNEGVLRVYRGDQTWPGYESVESPVGRQLPFEHRDDIIVTDNFSGKRSGGRVHHAIDLYMPAGTPILAVGKGKVIACGWHDGYGNHVVIDHGNGYVTRYAHLKKCLTAVGQEVKEGTKLGMSGNTGRVRPGQNGTGEHLHFDVRKNGKAIDPALLLDFSRYDKNRMLKGRKPHAATNAPSPTPEVNIGRTETGDASYYNLPGNLTANGESFDPNALKAAHNTLPLGTWVKVTNTATKKSVTVQINDRGPYIDSTTLQPHPTRKIDLTPAAFKALSAGGDLKQGTMPIKLEVVAAREKTAPQPPSPTPEKTPITPPAPSIDLLKKTPAERVAVTFNWAGARFDSYHPLLKNKQGQVPKKAPYGWLVHIDTAGKITLITPEGIKELTAKKSVVVEGKTYTVGVEKDTTNKKFPACAQFALTLQK